MHECRGAVIPIAAVSSQADEYQRFLKGQNVISGMSGIGSCMDSALVECFFSVPGRERVN